MTLNVYFAAYALVLRTVTYRRDSTTVSIWSVGSVSVKGSGRPIFHNSIFRPPCAYAIWTERASLIAGFDIN